MKLHKLIQGSPEWHAHRASYFNASDAPAMMGLSPYKTRTQLLHEYHTGLTPEINEATQAIFNAGHRYEALARPMAEDIIGKNLSPAVGSKSKLSASFDGITQSRATIWEHKSLNAGIEAAITQDKPLPVHLRIQMEHQLMVSEATECLFMATDWNGDKLVKAKSVWYKPDFILRKQIIDGWAQFEKELDMYEAKEVNEPPKGRAIMALPALSIKLSGKVTNSNLPVFKAAADKFIAEISTTLNTDEDFADAETTVKFCKSAEDTLETAKAAAIAQTSSIDELMRTVDHIQAQLREKRLALDKLVTKRKTEIKESIVYEYRAKFVTAKNAMEESLGLPGLLNSLPQPDWAEAMKNKRTVASLRDSVNNALAAALVNLNNSSATIKASLDWYTENAKGFEFLFADIHDLVFMDPEAFKAIVKDRIAEYKKPKAKSSGGGGGGTATKAKDITADEIISVLALHYDMTPAKIKNLLVKLFNPT